LKKLQALVALSAALLAGPTPPAEARSFPTEIAAGPTIGFLGPGIALRHFPLPWLGYQVGANTLFVSHYAGGTVMLSQYYDTGWRFYGTGGVAFNVGKGGFREFAVGAGVSQLADEHTTVFADVSVVNSTFLWSNALLPSLQVGLLYTF
jgi:hypothetical protein